MAYKSLMSDAATDEHTLSIYFRRLRKLGYQVYFLIKMSSKLRRSFPDKVKWNTERHLYKLANGNSSDKKIMLWNFYAIFDNIKTKNKLKTKFYDLESDKTCDILNKWLVK